ncbi:MAG: hypothetical protein ACREMA_02095 [Longimicrobiales bacterium]
MAFDLEVEFTGLCLYVENDPLNKVTVLMPDARRSFADDVHIDNASAHPHVGYLRVDAAHLGMSVAPGPEDRPRPEFIYQFDKQNLDFGINAGSFAGAPPALVVDLGLPDFPKILGPAARVRNGCLDEPPPANVLKLLLFRTALQFGSVRGRRSNGNWTIRNGVPLDSGQFSEVIKWKCPGIQRDGLSLTISNLDEDGQMQSLRLIPIEEVVGQDGNGFDIKRQVIRLKIANLCSTNPLEWDGLITHVVHKTDDDFKWLYRLIQPTAARLAVPELVGFQAFGVEDCTGGKTPGP